MRTQPYPRGDGVRSEAAARRAVREYVRKLILSESMPATMAVDPLIARIWRAEIENIAARI